MLAAHMLYQLCILKDWCRSRLENELYIPIWLFWKLLHILKIDHWFEISAKNDDKWLIRSIQIKYKIIIIVQLIIPENVGFVVQYQKHYSNPLCVIYLLKIGITKIGQFSKWCLLALNRVTTNRVIFGVSSPIEIQSTPCPDLRQPLTLTG